MEGRIERGSGSAKTKTKTWYTILILLEGEWRLGSPGNTSYRGSNHVQEIQIAVNEIKEFHKKK